ncbi:hypothetical protein HHX48_15960 [Salinimonas sp. HHU 13199]|uniref:Uncharacterized protein n=1 Tax=Salinimonas profundi TaxID=2729140 RepID=A0ABR8LPI6_9ALTE|nr:hypothetical protein [Salinimonas profundi]MBD3587235.1 hypothetical protein [Salinimonas profundi]
MQNIRFVLTLFLAVTALGCVPENSISTISMSPPFGSEGPWQLITYDEKRLEREVVKFENGETFAIAKAVYMNRYGKIVFKDGSPILTIDGDELYWNDQGLFLTSAGHITKKSRYFSIDGKPVSDSIPLMFRDTLLQAKADLASQKTGAIK